MDLLPDGVLADILCRLAQCSLAASRCVSKSWRATIDTMRLLRTDLLPLRLDGFFCLDNILADPPFFFSRDYRRSSASTTGLRRGQIAGRLDFLDTPWDLLQIVHHCNGLLLTDFDRVANPATRQWVALPPSPSSSVRPMGDDLMFRDYCLVYDPMVSPHYEVLMIHLLPSSRVLNDSTNSAKLSADSEWPPSPYATHVFSSRSWRWEERSFVRQGLPVATIADMIPGRLFERHSIYLRGKLYHHCENHTVMRIDLSKDRYRVIRCPTMSQITTGDGVLTLGKSEKGVYSASLWNEDWPQFRVWFLDESCEQMEWVLKSSISLQAVVQNFPFMSDNIYSSWAVTSKSDGRVERAEAQEELEWDWDDGVAVETKDDDDGTCYSLRQTTFLGFHPFEEIAFFRVSRSRVISYHLNTSKVQDLGVLNTHTVSMSFPYTSCWMGELRENN